MDQPMSIATALVATVNVAIEKWANDLFEVILDDKASLRFKGSHICVRIVHKSSARVEIFCPVLPHTRRLLTRTRPHALHPAHKFSDYERNKKLQNFSRKS